MDSLFEGDYRHVVSTGARNVSQTPIRTGLQSDARTTRRWAIQITRSNGDVERLSELFDNEEECERQAKWFGSKIKGVFVNAVPVYESVAF